jgi:mono/diheme cytochrome c family protein
MKNRSLSIGLVLAALAMASSPFAWGADGAALYKQKCSTCHGSSGEGKPAMKAPALKGTSKSADEIVAFLTKGDPQKKAPHSKSISGVDETQAGAIAEFVKTLK